MKVNLSGTVQLPRTMATTTLTAQQLQQLAASRGQVLSSALQSALRGGNITQRTQLIARPATASTSSSTQQTVLRPQTVSLAVSQPSQLTATAAGQPRPSTIAIQRPMTTTVGSPIAVAVAGGQTAVTRTIALQPQQRTSSYVVSQSAAGRQQIVVASGAQAGVPRQIVMTQGGQPVRSGHILQLTGQGGQQHQIVVSQGGQLILSPPNSTT